MMLFEFEHNLRNEYELSEIRFLYRYITREKPAIEWEEIIARLKLKEPIDYILGYTYFYGLRLSVNPHTLIPRPETEELIEWIKSEYIPKEPMRILDIGTGSGCIALALSQIYPKAEVVAIDISPGALDTARANASKFAPKCDIRQIDILDPTQWSSLGTFDLIVSNPPYIPQSLLKEMSDTVINYEPHISLFVPDDRPYIYYESILEFGFNGLRPKGAVYMETSQDGYLEQYRGYEITPKQDYSNNQRFVKATKVSNRV